MSTESLNISASVQKAGTVAPTPRQNAQAQPSPSGTGRSSAPAVKAPDPEEMQRQLADTLTRLNEQMKQSGRALNFAKDQIADRTVITVRSTQTGEVIRQIPDETLLRVAHNIEQVKGMLLNKQI